MKGQLKNNAFVSNHTWHFDNIQSIRSKVSLRSLLSSHFNLGDAITFRNNTTAIFTDIIQLYANIQEHLLVYSDLEHPCFQEIISSYFPKKRTIFIEMYDDLLKGNIETIEDQLSKDYGQKSIYLISHVLWQSGVIINIQKMIDRIKKRNSKDVVIIDGAQALGNLDNSKFKQLDMSKIDFYLGCTHKWIGTKNTLGFVSINDTLMNTKSNFSQFLFLKDKFANYAGKIEGVTFDTSTKDTGLLLSILKHLDRYNYQQNNYPNDMDSILKRNKKIKSILCGKERRSKFTGYYGDLKDLGDILQDIGLDGSYLVADGYLPSNSGWLRLGL